jgi:hypothetical protein
MLLSFGYPPFRMKAIDMTLVTGRSKRMKTIKNKKEVGVFY